MHSCTRRCAVWLVAGALALCGCSDEETDSGCVAPCRAEREHIHVLKLVGTPYEMGRQHGELMAGELVAGLEWLGTDPLFSLLMALAESEGLLEDALAYSYPDVVDECRGIEDGARAAGVSGLTVDKCVGLAYADVIVELIEHDLAGACTQFVATGAATQDGSLVHGRNMDNAYLSYLIEHPTIIVRQPTDQIPYLEIGFPGSVSPHSGLNARGIAIASNENSTIDDYRRGGRSHIQMSRQVLQTASSLAEAEAFLVAQDHASAESLMVSDGDGRQAAVFEMTATHMGVRRLDADDVVYMSNHFVHDDMAPLHAPRDPETSTRCRFARLEQLLPAAGEQSVHGEIDLAGAMSVLRDTHNPVTGVTHPPDLFDGGGTIANNAALHSIVFLPERREVYVALGEPPVPQRPFIGFSLTQLLETDGLGETDPAVIE